jgi:FMN phosphatase YigB (HAD superfamily)
MKTILVDAVYTFIIEKNGKFNIFQQMHELLDSFPNEKVILTNANYDKFNYYGLDKMPYEVFTLKHTPEKTDPAYFKTLLNHLGLNADAVVYFEHNLDAFKTAQVAGIKSYYYDSEKKDLNSLKEFLTENL